MRKIGNVEVPRDAFIRVLKRETDKQRSVKSDLPDHVSFLQIVAKLANTGFITVKGNILDFKWDEFGMCGKMI